MGLKEAIERGRVTRQVIEENRLKREEERLREYNTQEAMKERQKISLRMDALIEWAILTSPTSDDIVATTLKTLRDNPEKLNEYKQSNNQLEGWLIGKIRKILANQMHEVIIGVLRKCNVNEL